MTYKKLDQMVREYERTYDYAVRTPFRGLVYTTADAKELQQQATAQRETLEYEVDRLYAQRSADPSTVDAKTAYRTQTNYLDALDLERRARQVVVNRQLYMPRKAITYLATTVHSIRNAWGWLTGRKRKKQNTHSNMPIGGFPGFVYQTR